MKAIPTVYQGVEYRSRLEARWAAFFDLIGWKHTYEPFDAEGYIPDFLIHGAEPLLVEIKPAVTLEDYQAPIKKAEQGLSGHWKHDILILGADPRPRLESVVYLGNQPTAGYLGENMLKHNIDYPLEWDFDLGNWNSCGKCGALAVIHEMQSWTCRPCGHGDGDSYIGWTDQMEITKAWACAISATKWQPAALR